ncbi:MAG: aminotransferase class III-fold pyridoxal phosphate-dependent enzyme [Alphaproteobacteria bacterium]|nr:aminotransferase class III-fold pyridoxal phosphate-dependent enzyme [Alphaproteobacteria bacterium]
MPDSTLTNSRIVAAYREKTRKSAALAKQAGEIYPSGLTHDSRRLDPYCLYADRAQGSRKWDVDGNEYVDYFGGHGALLLGHNHPDIVKAVQAQAARGTHYGSGHELEIRWGRLVQKLIPCAELVRFTSSGTEANLMAFRLARAFTGKNKVVRFHGHFHGWQDHVAFGVTDHFDGTPSTGVVPGIADEILLAPADDIEETRRILTSHDDIAAVILEPTGSGFGQVPVSKEFVAELRRITEKRGILLIFDEVVAGFRASKGGAQAHFGIMPDIASLAKILAGGLPGGAVCGRRDILELLDFDVTAAKGKEKIGHQGTFNANPLSAAAGVVMLEAVDTTDATGKAIAQAKKLRAKVNRVFEEEKVAWSAYGQFSEIHFFTNLSNMALKPSSFDPFKLKRKDFKADKIMVTRFRLGLMVNGMDINGKLAGKVSAVHSDEDLDASAEAVRKSVHMLKNEGAL